jgi:hypothetical protein
MPNLTINVHVTPRAAILAGKTAVGKLSFVLSEDDLETLPENLRLELALAYESSDFIGENPDEPAVIEASLDAIRPVLIARRAQRQQQEKMQLVEHARNAELAAVAARDNTQKDNARSKALRTWVAKNGDEEQRARMLEGFLPESEILDDITADLLDMPGFKPYEPLRRGDACDCGCAHRVNFTVTPPKYMDAFQFSKLQAVREAAPEGAAIVPREHRAACDACKCVPIARVTAFITLPWNGWALVREFLLA